jgi:hypothetical protein
VIFRGKKCTKNRPHGLLEAAFWKLYKWPKFWGFFNPRKSFCIIFDEKWFGLHFGPFLGKLIRSPWILLALHNPVCTAQMSHNNAS